MSDLITCLTGNWGGLDHQDQWTLRTWTHSGLKTKEQNKKNQKNTFGFKLSTNLIVMDDKKV